MKLNGIAKRHETVEINSTSVVSALREEWLKSRCRVGCHINKDGDWAVSERYGPGNRVVETVFGPATDDEVHIFLAFGLLKHQLRNTKCPTD